jgi:hypothetical protein
MHPTHLKNTEIEFCKVAAAMLMRGRENCVLNISEGRELEIEEMRLLRRVAGYKFIHHVCSRTKSNALRIYALEEGILDCKRKKHNHV